VRPVVASSSLALHARVLKRCCCNAADV
jgi:hypothetical protein